MNTDIFKKKLNIHLINMRTIMIAEPFVQKEIMFVLLHFLYQEISITNKKKKSTC